MVTNGWRAFLAVGFLFLTAGCRGPATFVHPRADLRDIKRVAVLPFENLSGDRVAAGRVQQLMHAELLAQGAFEVAEPELVTRAMGALPEGARTPEDLKKLGEALQVEGLFLGTVVNYSESRGGRTGAEVTLNLRLVEARSGQTMWSSTQTRSGAGFGSKLLGLTGESCTELARTVIKEQLATLTQ